MNGAEQMNLVNWQREVIRLLKEIREALRDLNGSRPAPRPTEERE